jgi:hypothetical protein
MSLYASQPRYADSRVFIVILRVVVPSVNLLNVVMLSVVMLNVIMLIIVMLSVVMLSVVMLNVVGPFKLQLSSRPIKNFLKRSLRFVYICVCLPRCCVD